MENLELKRQLKTLSEQQRDCKLQRKTKNFTGTKTISPEKATYMSAMLGEKLRIMYAAYGLLRGKSLVQVESNYTEDNRDHFLNNPDIVRRLNECVQKYTPKEVTDEEKVVCDHQ